jgi:hypothetical protein
MIGNWTSPEENPLIMEVLRRKSPSNGGFKKKILIMEVLRRKSPDNGGFKKNIP